jgi:hypothetical protein
MLFKWFSTAESDRFGKELAAFILSQLEGSLQKRDAKFARNAARALENAAKRVQAFRVRERMNFFKKARLANSFLWALKDGGCPDEYANELTDWLTVRL